MRRRDLIAMIGGAAAGWPLTARAQQTPMPVIGFLNGGSPADFAHYVAAFRQGLKEAGFIDGQNVAIEYQWAEGHYDRLPEMAADLVARKVDVIVAAGGAPEIQAAKTGTSTIPIVFLGGYDPVAAGIVARLVGSLARPGGNLTGVSLLGGKLTPKGLELLLELVPQATVIALLVNPNNPTAEGIMRDMQEAAGAKGMELHILKASTESEFDAAVATVVPLHAGALVLGHDPFINSRINQLAEALHKTAAAAHAAAPAIYEWRGLIDDTRFIALLVNPNNPTAEGVMRDAHEAAAAKRVGVLILKAGTEREIDAAFAKLPDALLVSSDPFFDSRREQLVALASRYAIPVIYPGREYALAGGLISYGPSIADASRQVGIYVGKILKGEKPADLPVQQPTKFELVINLKTAKALGLAIPQSILAQADEVIE